MFQLYGMKMIPVPHFCVCVAVSVVGGAGLCMGYRRRFGLKGRREDNAVDSEGIDKISRVCCLGDSNRAIFLHGRSYKLESKFVYSIYGSSSQAEQSALKAAGLAPAKKPRGLVAAEHPDDVTKKNKIAETTWAYKCIKKWGLFGPYCAEATEEEWARYYEQRVLDESKDGKRRFGVDDYR